MVIKFKKWRKISKKWREKVESKGKKMWEKFNLKKKLREFFFKNCRKKFRKIVGKTEIKKISKKKRKTAKNKINDEKNTKKTKNCKKNKRK